MGTAASKPDDQAVAPEQDPNKLENGEEKKEEKKEDGAASFNNIDQEFRYWVSQGNEEKIRELQKNGADVNAPDKGIILTEEEKKKKEEMKKKGTHDPMSKVAEKISGDYPLHVAAENNHVKVIELLFFLGAKMDCSNRLGSTPLHRAVSMNHPEAVLELLTRGADIHAQNRMGMTPLHVAVCCGYMDMVKMLLEKGAAKDLRVHNKVHMTPIEYTLKNSPERQFLLSVDPTLNDLLQDEENDDEKADENESKTDD